MGNGAPPPTPSISEKMRMKTRKHCCGNIDLRHEGRERGYFYLIRFIASLFRIFFKQSKLASRPILKNILYSMTFTGKKGHRSL
jgi:hypothetical protein